MLGESEGGMRSHLAMFYRLHQMWLKRGLFKSAAPLLGPLGGLLANGLGQMEHDWYSRWSRAFFSKSNEQEDVSIPPTSSVIEGFATVVFACASYSLCPTGRVATALILTGILLSDVPSISGQATWQSFGFGPTNRANVMSRYLRITTEF